MKNSSYWHNQPIQTNTSSSKNYDVIIVGGGIAGVSTAYWLEKENPKLKIAILEKNKLGSGASGRNAGFVTCGSLEHFMKLDKQFGLNKALEIWKFSEENRTLLLEHIIQDNAKELDFRHTGSCTVAPSSEYWVEYKKMASTMNSFGIDVEEIDPTELERDYGVTGFEGAIQYKGDGYIHPIKLLNKIVGRLKCDFIEDCEVLAIDKKTTTQVVKTSKGHFECNQVALTLNAYLPLVVKNFSSLISPGRGQILLTKPLPAFVKGPCYLTKHLCYFRQLPSGELLIGGFRNLSLEAETTYSNETTELIQNALWNFVKSHFKHGPKAEVGYRWSGTMGFSKDGQMIIGALPENSNVYLMTGCSGHGMGLSFNAARTLAGNMMGRFVPDHLHINRFLANL